MFWRTLPISDVADILIFILDLDFKYGVGGCLRLILSFVVGLWRRLVYGLGIRLLFSGLIVSGAETVGKWGTALFLNYDDNGVGTIVEVVDSSFILYVGLLFNVPLQAISLNANVGGSG